MHGSATEGRPSTGWVQEPWVQESASVSAGVMTQPPAIISRSPSSVNDTCSTCSTCSPSSVNDACSACSTLHALHASAWHEKTTVTLAACQEVRHPHFVVFLDGIQHGGALREDGAEGLELRQSDDGEELRTEKLKQKS